MILISAQLAAIVTPPLTLTECQAQQPEMVVTTTVTQTLETSNGAPNTTPSKETNTLLPRQPTLAMEMVATGGNVTEGGANQMLTSLTAVDTAPRTGAKSTLASLSPSLTALELAQTTK